MGIVRTLAVVALALGMSACACHTKKVGNIPSAEDGGPLRDVHYAFDSYKLDEASKGIIADNAKWLKENPKAKVEVEGHCDERGTNEYNMVLGQNRARAAMEQLGHDGISKDRMSTVSYGEETPLDPAHNESAWAKNRRAHFRVK